MHLISFFLHSTLLTLCSFDVRGQGSEVGRHWNDGSLGARARFEEKARPQPLLWIEDLRDDDEGTYRCRVDFKHAPTQNFKINLQVIGMNREMDNLLQCTCYIGAIYASAVFSYL